MASSASNRLRRTAVPTNERWTPRHSMDDNCRKNSVIEDSLLNSTAECYWNDDERARRYEGPKYPNNRQGDVPSDHELYDVPEEKTSDESSVTEVEINDNERGDLRPTYRQYEGIPKKYEKPTREYAGYGYGKAPGSYRTGKYESVDDDDRRLDIGVTDPVTVAPNSQKSLRDYVNSVNLPQALMAMRKLERLKELQRRRDLSERFYSQEIRRLIAEHFSTEKNAIDPINDKIREKNRIIDGTTIGDTRMRAGGYVKELEPCGTMTTITRLDCGCVKETTRPIFNSSIGHVQKCDGHRYQERTVPKLTSSNPQELNYRLDEPPTRYTSINPTRGRARCFGDSNNYKNPACTISRDSEAWDDRRATSAQQRIKKSPRNASPVRNTSPIRQYTDASSN